MRQDRQTDELTDKEFLENMQKKRRKQQTHKQNTNTNGELIVLFFSDGQAAPLDGKWQFNIPVRQ